jgi:LDH2 family malate/lactate/ureidoglycolate dehydrogenase
MLRQLRETPPAEGEEMVYFAGQKEFESEKLTLKNGIQLLPKTVDSLKAIGKELGIAFVSSL